MLRRLPQAVPEIPVSRIDEAAAFYVVLGFQLDWGSDEGGIAGISHGDCRLFLTNSEFRNAASNPVVIWLNLESKAEVDELYDRWRKAGANILSEPEDKPWRLREFTVADPDGNRFRVFYDFSQDAENCR